MEMGSKSEFSYFVTKLGISLPSDQLAFRNLYNFIFCPFKLNVQLEEESATTTDPAITRFQTVFRKQFRQSAYIVHLPSVELQAETEFEKCVAGKRVTAEGRVHQDQGSSSSNREQEVEQPWAQMVIEKVWIQELNAWRKDHFVKAARADAERDFKEQLSSEYPLSAQLGNYFEDADLLRFSEELKPKIVNEFLAEFPSFEEKAQLDQWALELLEALSAKAREALKMNRQSRKMWDSKLHRGVVEYWNRMTNFLEERPFARKERLEGFHAEAKMKCEEEPELARRLHHPAMRATWEARVDQEFQVVKAKWRAEREGKIAEFQKAVKADLQRRWKLMFKVSLEGSEAEKMISAEIPHVATANLEREDEFYSAMNEVLVLSPRTTQTQTVATGSSNKRSTDSSGGDSTRKMPRYAELFMEPAATGTTMKVRLSEDN